jgi:NAD(P)-dependent dehydrogenase (short-subunit alcohol dehydrogenase family)
VRQVLDPFGRLDVVVSNAADYATGPVTELTGAVLPVDGGTSASTGQSHG